MGVTIVAIHLALARLNVGEIREGCALALDGHVNVNTGRLATRCQPRSDTGQSNRLQVRWGLPERPPPRWRMSQLDAMYPGVGDGWLSRHYDGRIERVSQLMEAAMVEH